MLKCNEQLRKINPVQTLESYSNLVYAHKVQGKTTILSLCYSMCIYIIGTTGQVGSIITVINEMEHNNTPVNSNIISCLMRTYCNNGNIAEAIDAYYQTSHLASPKKSVFRSLLDKCVANKDVISAELGNAMCSAKYS